MHKKVIAIHQPNFLPWLGYFHKIAQADLFVLLDDVEYTKNSYINRNRIKTSSGIAWLSLPVKYSGRSKQFINEVELNEPARNKKKLLKTLEANYAKAPHFKKHFPNLQAIFESEGSNLCDLNIELLQWACTQLAITTPLIKSSTLDLANKNGSDRLIAICQAVEATEYLAGFGGKKYQEDKKFSAAGIALSTSDFVHPEYPQLWGDFAFNLSVVDSIMNGGG